MEKRKGETKELAFLAHLRNQGAGAANYGAYQQAKLSGFGVGSFERISRVLLGLVNELG